MKRIILYFLLSFLATQLPAQIKYASDFDAVDTRGVKHNLFNLLDNGKVVMLVFFSTSDPASFSYHQGNFLKELYEARGIDVSSDNLLEILYIEADPNTSDNCLTGTGSGCGGNQVGPFNWTTGTPFPIVSSTILANSFDVTSFPSVRVICPTRRVRSLPALSDTELSKHIDECPLPGGGTDISLHTLEWGFKHTEICGNPTLKPSFFLVNSGSTPITNVEMTITIKFDDLIIETIKFNANDTLQQFEERQIIGKAHPVQDSGVLTAFVNVLPNEVNIDNNRLEQVFTSAITLPGLINVRIRTDDHAKEIYWQITNAATNAMEQFGGNLCVGPNGGGNPFPPDTCPSFLSNNKTVTRTVQFEEKGCYIYRITDAFGDGIACQNPFDPCGYYIYPVGMLDPQKNAPIQAHDYGDLDEHIFFVGSVDMNPEPILPESAIQLMPNPVADQITIHIVEQSIEGKISIFSSTGQLMLTQPESANSWTLPISHWPPGVYVATVRTENGLARKFFVKE